MCIRDRDRGIQYLTADVLTTNKGMMKVFEKDGAPVTAKLDHGVYHLTIPLGSEPGSEAKTLES